MDEETAEKIHATRFYLGSLPNTLPITGRESSINALLSFSLNPEWVEDVGEEGAVNQALEAALFQFLPRNDAGIFKITTRGPAISALANVLETWIKKYPASMILQKWLQNALDSAKACFAECNVPVGKPFTPYQYFHRLSAQLPPIQSNEATGSAKPKKALKNVKKPDTTPRFSHPQMTRTTVH